MFSEMGFCYRTVTFRNIFKQTWSLTNKMLVNPQFMKGEIPPFNKWNEVFIEHASESQVYKEFLRIPLSAMATRTNKIISSAQIK